MNDVHHIITKRNEIGPFSTPPGSGSGVFGLELAGGKHKDLRSRCPVKKCLRGADGATSACEGVKI